MKYISLVIVLCLLSFLAKAQEADTTSKDKIKVVYADLQRTFKTDNGFDRYLEGDVQIIKDSSYFYCDTARINDQLLKAWGDVSMIKSDSLEVFADSMVYDIPTEEADIYGSVYVKNKDQVLFSDFIHYDDKTDIAYYTDKAILQNNSVILKSKRGEFRTQQDLAIFSQKVSVKDSAFQLFADTLLYDTKLNKAIFQGPTDIILDSANVYCEAGYFLMDTKYGVFEKNARYEGLKDTATADIIKADGVKNEVELFENAVYKGETAYASGDYIRYNSQTGEVEVRGNAYVKDGEQELESDVIFYNRNTKKFDSEGRSVVSSESNILMADNIKALDKTGIATGTVVFQDTASGVRIDSETLEFDQSNSAYNKAYTDGGKALLRAELEKNDTLFVSADTLYSFQKVMYDTIETMNEDSTFTYEYLTDTTDFLTAYYGVKIFNAQFQAVCDSMAYNTSDSVLTLYKKPIMWSDTSQFKADTIVMYFKESTIDRMSLFPKSLIVNSTDEIFFNQIRGKISDAYFTEGKLDSMVVFGNAQSIYYMQDDNNAYIGVNKTDCSEMIFHFIDGELDDIDFNQEPVASLFPMEDVDHEAIKLEGFSWEINRRPKRKTDIHPMIVEAEKKSIIPEAEEVIER